MNDGLVNDFASVTNIAWFLFSRGGWVVFVVLVVYILFKVYVNEIQTNFKNNLEWVTLEVKPPKENLASFYNAEQIFIQLHQLFDNWTFSEKYIDGKLVFWASFEIVSLGGKISYIMRVPIKQRELLEASLYANFPNIEVNEVDDYLQNFDYNPDDNKYDLFGGEFVLAGPQSFPIRTYREFISLKAPDASEKVVDPLNPLMEVFTRLSPHEFYAYQLIFKPVGDAAWKDEAEKLVEELQGEKDFMQLDDVTKLRIAAVKAKLGKPGFESKIRILHIGAKEHFNPDAKKLILSPFRIFNSANFNSMKYAFGPKLDYRISPTLEAPFINYWVRQRKVEIFKAFKARSTWIGEKNFILNTEELATLFHFPVSDDITVSSIETVDMKKIQPPANLPI